MTGLVADLRSGLRALSKSASFTCVAIASLALGIGANTTVFTLLNAVFLRPMPVADPGSLATIATEERGLSTTLCSYPNYLDFRDHNTVFSSLLLFTPTTLSLTGSAEPQMLMGQLVSANYFSTLGLKPAIGRGFLPEEDVIPGGNAVAVISYGLWTSLYGSDPRITDRSIRLNGQPYRIVGVAPAGFLGLAQMAAADVYVPMARYQQIYAMPNLVPQRRALLFTAVGRLKPETSLRQAEAAMQSLANQLERQYPKENAGRQIRLMPAAEAAIRTKDRSAIANAGAVLMTISGLILLIACANVANLLLARAGSRRREMTVRLALGARPWHLVRQLVAESLMLSLAGGIAGLALAHWATQLLWAVKPPAFHHAAFRLEADIRVLAFNFAVAVGTGVVFGLVPAFRLARADLATDLKERSAAAGPGMRARSFLVIGQVALSLIALVGAGLFLRSLQSAGALQLGFDAPHLALVGFNLGEQGYKEGPGREFYQKVLERAAAVPGVTAAALSKDYPLTVASARTVLLEGQDASAGRTTLTSVVSPGYFPAMAIPLLRGRDFSPLDTRSTPRVVIVNEAAAAVFWPGDNPIGKRIQFAGEGLPVEVIGLARNAKYRDLSEGRVPLVYLSLVQYHFSTAVLLVRTAGPPAAVLPAVRREVQSLDRNLYLQAETLETTIHEALWPQRLSAALLAVFGGLALLLSTIGIYGVIAYSVNLRRREMGVRMALGATPGAVRARVLGEGIRLVAVGLACGTVAALAAARLVRSMLFAISPSDALTFIGVPVLLGVVALAACWLPSAQATAIDPAVVLREE